MVEFDIRGACSTISITASLMTALRKHCQEPWILLYAERWLRAPMQSVEGQLQAQATRARRKAAIVSPIPWPICFCITRSISWVTRHLPGVRFARYADDAMLHCKSRRQAEYVLDRIRERFPGLQSQTASGQDTDRVLQGHQSDRGESRHPVHLSRLHVPTPRKAVDKYGRVYVNFSPAVRPRRPQGDAANNSGMAGPN